MKNNHVLWWKTCIRARFEIAVYHHVLRLLWWFYDGFMAEKDHMKLYRRLDVRRRSLWFQGGTDSTGSWASHRQSSAEIWNLYQHPRKNEPKHHIGKYRTSHHRRPWNAMEVSVWAHCHVCDFSDFQACFTMVKPINLCGFFCGKNTMAKLRYIRSLQNIYLFSWLICIPM